MSDRVQVVQRNRGRLEIVDRRTYPVDIDRNKVQAGYLWLVDAIDDYDGPNRCSTTCLFGRSLGVAATW